MSVEKRAIPMQWSTLAWLLSCAGLLSCSGALTAQVPTPQGGIPATAPTVVPGTTSAPTTSTPTSGASEASSALTPLGPKPVHRAEVSYSEGKLQITADDSSLNQILREVQRQTGMKITGGVAEERVFGKYGPASLAEVLAGLLDGTGSNMLLVGADHSSPAELILTPRQGGASPPSPSALAADDREERLRVIPQPVIQPVFQPDRRAMAPPGPPNGPPVGVDNGVASPGSGVISQGNGVASQGVDPSLPPPSVVPPPSGGSTAATSPDAGNPQSPNGVKTPQQIYQQLILMQQKLQQQQQANPQ
jgi:hypothetical protein